MNDVTPRPAGVSRRRALRALAAGVVGGRVAATASPASASTPTAFRASGERPPRPSPRVRAGLPKGVRPSVVHVVAESALTPEEQVLIATLQGRLARAPGARGPAIYLDLPGVGYEVWLNDLADRYGIPVRRVDDPWLLLEESPTTEYVVYSRTDGSVNAATSVAAALGVLAVEESLEARVREYGLRPVVDVRGRTDAWVKETYWDRLRHDLVLEQKPDFGAQLRDYAVLAGAYLFYDGNSEFRRAVVEDLEPDATVLGWGDASQGENVFVSASSRAGARTIPADHARNLACLSGISIDRLTQRGDDQEPEVEPDVHYVAFLMTDGDNIQWLLGDFQSSERWYASPHRGSFPMGWGMAPALIDLAPSVMQWYYEHQSTGAHSDRFVVGPSGGGYLYPSMYPREELELHVERLAETMARTDLHAVQILDFDALENTDLWSVYLRHEQIDGLIYLEYSRYDGHRGRVVWANDKPVISARTMLWDGLDGADEASVTALLNAAERNPASAAGYSIVMVHCWSKDMSSVKTVVDGLAPHVRVVPPDTLVRLVARNVVR